MSDLPFMVRAMTITRWVVLGCAIFFTIIVLGASAHYIALEMHSTLLVDDVQVWPTSSADPWAALGVAVSVISLIMLKPMYIIDFFRRGAFTSMIVTELSALGFLCIMWLATASYATSIFTPLASLCSNNPSVSSLQAGCTDMQLTMAFGWLNWIVLLVYWTTLLTLAIMASQRGKPVWKASVRENDFGYGRQSPAVTYTKSAMRSNEQFLLQKTGATPMPPVNNTSPYNTPYVNPQTSQYDPSRPMGGAGYAYPGVAQV